MANQKNYVIIKMNDKLDKNWKYVDDFINNWMNVYDISSWFTIHSWLSLNFINWFQSQYLDDSPSYKKWVLKKIALKFLVINYFLKNYSQINHKITLTLKFRLFLCLRQQNSNFRTFYKISRFLVTFFSKTPNAYSSVEWITDVLILPKKRIKFSSRKNN